MPEFQEKSGYPTLIDACGMVVNGGDRGAELPLDSDLNSARPYGLFEFRCSNISKVHENIK